ncbi:MAG: hypothetical protein ACXW32_05475 [Limisphaerales bacterium]
MKRALITVTTLALLGASVPRVEAGDKEWATAGKVMAGVGAGLLLAKAFELEPVYVERVYSPPPVYVNPAPVVYQHAPVVVHQPVQQVVVQQPRTTVVYTQPAQTVVVQQPVVYQPAPVIYAPAPVVYAPAPVIYHPAPVYYGRPVYHGPRHHYHHHGHHHRPSFGFHISVGNHRRHR